MPKIFKISAIFLLSLLFGVAYAYAGGLSSHFVEEKLVDVRPGKMYSVEKMVQKPLVVTNTTKDVMVDIQINAEKPVDYNLVSGYEPIPNLGWVRIVRKNFRKVGPGQSAKTDIIIRIPPDKKYYGKKYQVYIYSHTAGKGTFRLGIMSRILIHTAQK